jgi:hypothetical protein
VAENPLGGTLFIPPTGKKGKVDDDILSQLFDKAHLAEITRQGDE